MNPQTPDNEVAMPSDKSMLTAQSDPLALYHALCDMTKDLIEKTNEVERLHNYIKRVLLFLDSDLPTKGTKEFWDEYESQYGKIQ